MKKHYFETHSGFDLCDHALSVEFDYRLDAYEVIPYALGSIDHAPTICVFNPTKKVSSRRRNTLMEMYKKHIKDIKSQINITGSLTTKEEVLS